MAASSSSSHFLALTAILTVGYQMIFLVTALFRFDKHSDFAGSTNFVLLAILTLYLKGACHFRQVVLTTLVVVWGLRLGLFLLMRIFQWGEDRRFDKIRNSLSKLAVFWIFQAAWVWTVSLPVTIVNASDRNPPIKVQDIIGWSWTIWFLGFCIEVAADQQKLWFKSSPSNKGKWCNLGLWRSSRVVLFAKSFQVLLVCGMMCRCCCGGEYCWRQLQFSRELSGFSVKKSADKRFSGIEEYRLYKKTTSLPPGWIKFELPLYNQNHRRQRADHVD